MRPLAIGDIPQLTELHAKAFGGTRDRDGLSDFLGRLLFGHPWLDDCHPSLVYEDGEGRVVGCLGVMPRPMSVNGRPVRCVVSHNFMVAPEARGSLVSVKLLSAFVAGPQALTLCDANLATRTIAERLDTHVLQSHSTRWLRVLRPLGFGAHVLERKGLWPGVRRVLDVAARLPDALARLAPGSSLRAPGPEVRAEPLSPGRLAELLADVCRGYALRPRYDERSTSWLMDMLRRTRRSQTLRAMRVPDAGGRSAGWYLYFARRGAIAQVLQLGGAPEHHDRVLSDLFADAAAAGAVAVSGQVDPAWAPALRRARALFRGGRSWVMFRTQDDEVRRALTSGNAFLTRLEGEGWIQLAY